MKLLIFVCAILISSTALAECNFGNVYQDLKCEQKTLELRKRELNQAYQKLFKNIDLPAQKHLENSQKIWLQYRDSHCRGLVEKLSEQTQGAGQALIVTSCMSDLTDKRTQEIKKLI